MGDFQEIRNLWDNCLKDRKQWNRPEISDLSKIAETLIYLEESEKAKDCWKKIKSIKIKKTDEQYALAMYTKALVDYNNEGTSIKFVDKILQRVLDHHSEIYYELQLLRASMTNNKEMLDSLASILNGQEDNYSFLLAKVYDEIALYYDKEGNFDSAYVFQKKEVELMKMAMPEKHFLYGRALSDLGDLASLLCYYDEACSYYKKAIDVLEERFSLESIQIIRLYSSLGSVYRQMGKIREALECASTAYFMAEKYHNNDDMIMLQCRHNYAMCLYCYNRTEEALKLTVINDSIWDDNKEFKDFNLNGYFTHLGNYSACLCSVGQYEKALKINEKCISAISKAWGEDHVKCIQQKMMTGGIYYFMGEYDQVISLYNKNKEKFAESYSNNVLFYSEWLNLVGKTYNEIGDFQKSLALFDEQMSICKQQFGEDNRIYLDCLGWAFEVEFNNGNIKKSLELLKDYFSRTRRRIDSSIYERSGANNYIFWESYDFSLTKLIPLYCYNQKDDSEWLKLYYDILLFRNGMLLNAEIEESKDKQIPVTSLSWESITEAINEDEIAIEFDDVQQNDSSSQICALIVKKGYSSPQLIPLCSLEEIKKLQDNHRSLYGKLYDLIWKPLEQDLEGVRNVYFSPSKFLNLVNIESSVDKNGNIISEDFNMYRLSSTRELLVRNNDNPLKGMALFGGIDYNSKNQDEEQLPPNQETSSSEYITSDAERGTLEYLNGSLECIHTIAEFIPSDLDYDIYSGKEATKDSFLGLSGDEITILHIDTHGYYYGENSTKRHNRSQLLVGQNQGNEDLLLYNTGLYFAGVNKVLRDGRMPLPNNLDGIVTANDISKLRFKNLDLVVLAACQTGLGDLRMDGIYGLQRGFKKAGAKSIIMSLWKVSNISTIKLMVEFYKNYFSGKSKRESLQSGKPIQKAWNPHKFHPAF